MPGSERETIVRDLAPGFTVTQGEGMRCPFVFSSPHSGSTYPASFLRASRLSVQALRKSEDSFVEELFAGVSRIGAPMIAAGFPRAYLDVNREPYELDPLLFREPVPAYAKSDSVRVVSGLGTIARVVADNEAIYRERLMLADAFARINMLYKPYHATLGQLLRETREMFGQAVLVDCHSMPSGNPSLVSKGGRADIVLGDRFGIACGNQLSAIIGSELRDAGFKVALNRPYAGGYITEHYGQPDAGTEAIQIEINRALYMDEEFYTRSANFEDVSDALERAFARIVARYSGDRAAAEAAE